MSSTNVESRGTSHEARKSRIRSFTDLRAWQMAHGLVVEVYKTTKRFPKDELFGLTNQVRRSAVSVTSNIAEGFGRRTAGDRIHFYDMARASLHELQSQLLVARDVNYLEPAAFQSLAVQSVACHKVLTGLINATKGRVS